jgi:hypothetical protein
LFLRRRLFSCPAKVLHCNWRAFSIVNPLYFFPKIFRRRADRNSERAYGARATRRPPPSPRCRAGRPCG